MSMKQLIRCLFFLTPDRVLLYYHNMLQEVPKLHTLTCANERQIAFFDLAFIITAIFLN